MKAPGMRAVNVLAPRDERGDLGATLERVAVDGPRVTTDGKFFRTGRDRLRLKGVTYGTFMPRADGALFPELETMRADFAAMAAAGFNVIRTYTEPPPDLLAAAGDHGLRVLAGVFYPDWRYLVGASRRDERRIRKDAAREVRAAARRLRSDARVLALCLGNEVPADAVRWVGTRPIARAIAHLADVARAEDPELLLTYANYPTAEYLPLPDLDFLTFNVFLEDRHDFRRYLTKLHHLAGDRPLVLGEIGLDAGEDEAAQARALEWQLGTALERGVAGTCIFSWTDDWAVGGQRVEGWSFGLTRADRSPRPALLEAAAWNGRSVGDLDRDWPSISVVVCAHNAAATLDECLRHTAALDYPQLEVIVVDDGSTDGTATIAEAHPHVRLVKTPHQGLGWARNTGLEAATGDLVAYLDSDAFPPPEWPYYLALGLDGPNVAGVGGPSLPPDDDPAGAQAVARAPGGPVHVLLSDDRAEHIPGCNMAFWRHLLEEVGSFDPCYRAAGDDVDVCWKILNRGWEISFHPGAFVWHRRRPGLRRYLRQQQGYGDAEALVQARHPDRFNAIGTARWQGRIYDSFVPSLARQRVYRGAYGAAAYQSVYRGGGDLADVAHQVGVPLALLAMLAAPLALVAWPLGLPALAGIVLILALSVLDALRASPPRRFHSRRLRFRLAVAAMHLLQPALRLSGRLRAAPAARRDLPPVAPLPGPLRSLTGGALLLPLDRPRGELAAAAVTVLRRAGLRAVSGTGWEDFDALLLGSTLVSAKLVTSGYPEGAAQILVRRRLRPFQTVLALTAIGVATAVTPIAGAAVATAALAEIARGSWRTGRRARRALEDATR